MNGDEGLPLRRGASGEAVRDLQRRLGRAGFDPSPDRPGHFDEATESALVRFQLDRGLRPDGVCGHDSWNAVVEAGWRLGDRFLYQRRPMLRGDDVADLQLRLGALGFDAGRVDGIFGPDTHLALLDFQRNVGLTPDGICGTEAVTALGRVRGRAGSTTKVGVLEREALRQAPRHLDGRRVLVAESGGLAALAYALGRSLRDRGALVLLSQHPDDSGQAADANGYGAEVFLGLTLRDRPGVEACYWSTTGYESVGGQRLADLVAERVDQTGLGPSASRGIRLPALRETRMPAVVCRLGPPDQVVEQMAAVASVLRDAVVAWAAEPLER